MIKLTTFKGDDFLIDPDLRILAISLVANSDSSIVHFEGGIEVEMAGGPKYVLKKLKFNSFWKTGEPSKYGVYFVVVEYAVRLQLWDTRWTTSNKIRYWAPIPEYPND